MVPWADKYSLHSPSTFRFHTLHIVKLLTIPHTCTHTHTQTQAHTYTYHLCCVQCADHIKVLEQMHYVLITIQYLDYLCSPPDPISIVQVR